MFISPEKNIWSLPEFEPEKGKYTEDWDILSRYYNVPQWWRDAKFGAWSHWDPQSAAEYGDWYSRGMYMQGTPQYNYHLDHYGHPSQYGYKDLCNVSLLGDRKCRIEYVQSLDGLIVKAARSFEPNKSIRDTTLSEGFKVLKIEHDKKWFNDDDPGVTTIGWVRACNLGNGDFNNDLYFTSNPGDEWTTSFYGKSVTVVSPIGIDGGKMKIIIDGNDYGLVDLYSDVEKHQEKVFSHKFGKKGKHTIRIICADGNAVIDALIID